MTEQLEKAFAEAAKLSDEEQDAIAAWLLEELASEGRWAGPSQALPTLWSPWLTTLWRSTMLVAASR
jgi:hypothetical protein